MEKQTKRLEKILSKEKVKKRRDNSVLFAREEVYLYILDRKIGRVRKHEWVQQFRNKEIKRQRGALGK